MKLQLQAKIKGMGRNWITLVNVNFSSFQQLLTAFGADWKLVNVKEK